jgi:hypothetical protein
MLQEMQDLGSSKSLEQEIVSVIESLLIPFKDRKKGFRILSKKMGVHEKTLVRLLNLENKPGYQTVFKIYRVYFNEFNDVKLLTLVPKVVARFLEKSNSQVLESNKIYSNVADIELQKNPIVAELYILAATGPLHFSDVETRFGTYGIELLEKMLSKELLHQVHKDIFVTGMNHPVFNGETIVSVGSVMIAAHAKPGAADILDQNFISFFAEGLSNDAYQKWLQIDQEAYRKKFELCRNPANLGSTRAFTFMISEKIVLNPEAKVHHE